MKTPPPGASAREADEFWMSRAIALARRAEGMTRPNPAVGAVVVADGRCVGEGWHRRAGGPHAEVYALRQAGPRARGATLYVTLEPCSTYGRTPPCCEAVVKAGIARVVVGVADPNPRHAGRAFRLLRKHGIAVKVGVCKDAAADLLAPFACTMRRHRPFFSLKLAVSLDGRIADSTHSSRWISSPASRTLVQEMRRSSDAILVGAGTLLHDNPSLWPRPDKGRNPWRVVLAGKRPLPLDAKLFTDEHADRTLVVLPEKTQTRTVRELRKRGVSVLEVPKSSDVLACLSDHLFSLGVLKVFCEGGGQLAASLVKAGLVDEFCVFLAPVLVGGPVSAVGSAVWPLAGAPRFALKESRPIGPDLFLRYTPIRP